MDTKKHEPLTKEQMEENKFNLRVEDKVQELAEILTPLDMLISDYAKDIAQDIINKTHQRRADAVAREIERNPEANPKFKSSPFGRLEKLGMLTPDKICSESILILDKSSTLPPALRYFILYEYTNPIVQRALYEHAKFTVTKEIKQENEKPITYEEQDRINSNADGSTQGENRESQNKESGVSGQEKSQVGGAEEQDGNRVIKGHPKKASGTRKGKTQAGAKGGAKDD